MRGLTLIRPVAIMSRAFWYLWQSQKMVSGLFHDRVKSNNLTAFKTSANVTVKLPVGGILVTEQEISQDLYSNERDEATRFIKTM